ncbi:MAG: ribonuclease R [Lachnospiraceae bacterium]|nr:ribonuclease R [Lachnospiraceae bacterium]
MAQKDKMENFETKVRKEKQQKEELILTGTFTSHPKGFGFVTIDGEKDDYYIPVEETGNAFHLDQVEILPDRGRRRGQRRTAKVVRIVSHGITKVIGTFDQAKNTHFGFAIPDNTKLSQDIFVPGEHSMGAVTGHKVVCEITDYGSRNPVSGFRSPEGRIVEILGHENDPGVDILSIVRGFELPAEFGEAVLDQAARVAKPVSEADCYGRRDLRGVRMVTIDGDDAKDLDDAVSISFDGTNYHLGVHIADVSNYVQENSALDKEAKLRGTSVYLVDRVIPMLPHVLCNGICSLNAGEDRLALSCLMTVNQKGEIIDHEIVESVINVDKRMSYVNVKKLLDMASEGDHSADEALWKEHAFLIEDFVMMEKLAALLREKRRERGGIDFDLPECKIELDETGFPSFVGPYDRNEATRIIEDFMLAANETVAEHFYWMEAPFVYRVHGAPEEEKFRALSGMISNMGFSLKTTDRFGNKVGSGEIHPKEIQKLLDKIQGTPEEAMISRMVLRSMKQAKYSEICTGHFGLACRYYCHFTSPIRRYPDLQIHRIIREELRGRLNEERMAHYAEILPGVAEHSSKMERRADEAERETDRLKKVQYMSQHVGESFDGVISGVTSWGLYVELMNTVEGMIHVSKLPGDYYYFEEKSGEMVGEATGRRFSLGMPVRIIVDECDGAARTIDFSLAKEREDG